MSSAFPKVAAAVLLAMPAVAAADDLVVCADPNNLPFSNEAGEGFENRIAAIIADELGMDLRYEWRAQRRGFIRETLNAGLCNLVPGIEANVEPLLTTRPYYRSGYVFVTRTEDGLDIADFDDPRLRDLTVGVQLIGDDGANTPPTDILAERGIIDNLRGYPVYGNYADPDPAEPIIAAVASGAIDVAIVWGPVAGWYAPRQDVPLTVTPGPELDQETVIPLAFDIAMGGRRGDLKFMIDVDRAIAARQAEIDAVLADYGVPRFDAFRLIGGAP